MIDFGVIACGEGNRISESGIFLPKPLVDIDGEPMIGRILRIMKDTGAEKISIVLNQDMQEVSGYLDFLEEDTGIKLNVSEIKTPSSFHSFYELVKLIEPKDKFIVTTVDTVFFPEIFESFIKFFNENSDKFDGLMGVTDLIDDEKPLYVCSDQNLNITGFSDTSVSENNTVSAGVYGLKSNSIPVLKECMAEGCKRLRDFQKKLVASGLHLKAFDMGRVIDVDRPSDIKKANDLINQYKSTIKINSKWLK